MISAIGRRFFEVQFLLCWAVAMTNHLLPHPVAGASSFAVCVAASAAVATVAWQLRALPWQNVAAATIIALVLLSAAYWTYSQPGTLFWPAPFSPQGGGIGQAARPWPFRDIILWVVALFNARGAARFLLWRWHEDARYGFWLLALATLSFALLVFGFEIMDALAWRPVPSAGGGSHSYWSVLPVSALAGLLTLCCLTPWLIEKTPGLRTPHPAPVIIWALLAVLCVVNAWQPAPP